MNTSPSISTITSVSHAKAEGAFIALAAGDALGWPQEFASRGRGRQRPQTTTKFRDWERRSGGRYYAHTEIIRAGEYSDDTQLTLAVARCRIQAGTNWWGHFTRNELPLWIIYERGGGSATKQAAQSWLRSVAPWKQSRLSAVRRYFDAGGNGVAMRVIPHAIYCATDNEPINMLHDVIADGAATHGHPRALVGAAAYAYAAWWLLRSKHTVSFGELVSVLLDNASTWGTLPTGLGDRNDWAEAANKVIGDYEKTWRQVVEEMNDLLLCVRDGLSAGSLADDNDILERLGAFGRAKGAGTISTAAAVYLTARYASQPIQGVLCAAFAVRSDTDTIAAMTGGLLGALVGEAWIPHEWFSVQDNEYLRQIANKLATRPVPQDGELLQHVSTKDLNKLIKELLAGTRGDFDFGGTRRVRVNGFFSSARTPVVHTWQLQASDGQTLYVKKLDRNSEKEAAKVLEKPTEILPEPRSEHKLKARAVGVKLSVADLGASATFYESVVGLVAIKKTPKFVSFGALSLVDGRYAMDLSKGAVAIDASTDRNRVEIHMSDIDVVHERLVKHNVRVALPITLMPWGERSLHCFDPDGNIVEIVERNPR